MIRRNVPTMTAPLRITQRRKFSNPADYDAFSVIRLHNSCVTALGGRNTWVRIESDSGKTVFRMIRGAGAAAGFPADALEFDYETSLALGIPQGAANEHGFYPCSLSIRQATHWEILIAHWKHPDPAYRFPLQISLVSLLLGIIGFVLGMVSLK